MEKSQLHLFICTNFKEKGECCGPKGGKELRDALKALVKADPELKAKIKVTASGCLGFCEKGIAAVAYPKGEWSFTLKPDDLNILENYIRDQVK